MLPQTLLAGITQSVSVLLSISSWTLLFLTGRYIVCTLFSLLLVIRLHIAFPFLNSLGQFMISNETCFTSPGEILIVLGLYNSNDLAIKVKVNVPKFGPPSNSYNGFCPKIKS